ncbi:hypothetical protein MJI95_37915, partial [Salmonella enterica subsp. enterica serovar Kentucky]|nr:hypothetical protein [Salmonella enterica subsp. enterica serovar Kentucky]
NLNRQLSFFLGATLLTLLLNALQRVMSLEVAYRWTFIAAAGIMVIMVSDNESWVDKSRHGSTATMECWIELKKRNPQARLVCIDL